MKCPRPECGWEWKPKVASPRACPYCKRYLPRDERRLQPGGSVEITESVVTSVDGGTSTTEIVTPPMVEGQDSWRVTSPNASAVTPEELTELKREMFEPEDNLAIAKGMDAMGEIVDKVLTETGTSICHGCKRDARYCECDNCPDCKNPIPECKCEIISRIELETKTDTRVK